MLAKAVVVLLACAPWLGFQAPGDYPVFAKLEDAKAAAQATGKPILVFSNCDQNGGRNKQSPIEHDLWSHPLLKKYISEFHFVRCSDKKTAQIVGSKMVLTAEVIVLDFEGEEICRETVADASEVDAAASKALSKYCSRPVNWIPSDDSRFVKGSGTRAPYLVLFYTATEKAATSDADSEVVLKALEDRSLVKFHSRYLCVKLEFTKDSEESKKWAVTGAPTLLIVDASKEAGPKSVVDRLYGKRSAGQIRSALIKGLKCADKSKTAAR